MLYTNGDVPLSVVSVVLGSGYDSKGRFWEHRLTPSMAARWRFAVNYATNKWGRAFKIKAGANAYRNRAWQVIARTDACAAGNCNGASVVGYSSHGGNWNGRDCLAIDVDPNGLSWAQVWEACRAAGFECGLITQAISGIPGGEPWHIIDFAAFAALAGGGSTPFPITPEEDDMAYPVLVDGKHRLLIAPGFIKHFTDVTASDLTRNIVASTDVWIQLTGAQFALQLDSFGIPRDRVDVATGWVHDVSLGKKVAGGMWSWARDAATRPASATAAVDVGAIAKAVRAEFATTPLT